MSGRRSAWSSQRERFLLRSNRRCRSVMFRLFSALRVVDPLANLGEGATGLRTHPPARGGKKFGVVHDFCTFLS